MKEQARMHGMRPGASGVARGLSRRTRLYGPALLYLACHALAIAWSREVATVQSLLFLVATPALAATACAMRARRDAAWDGWTALAMAIALWSAGMAAAAAGTLIDGDSSGADGFSMLLYVLYGVPLIFVVASPEGERWTIRLIDAVLGMALGILLFVHTFAFATLTGSSTEGFISLRLMFDIENAFIAIFSTVRFAASGDASRRAFFATLGAFAWLYLATAGYINHFQSDVDFGTMADLVIDLPFLALAVMAMSGRMAPRPVSARPRRLASLVRAGSPLMLAATLLAVSSALVQERADFAIAGFVVASLGTGLRNMLVQTRSQEERDALDTLARCDTLTGLANRRRFDEALEREWHRARRGETGLALLMIDIDHFKAVNDSLGHQGGDMVLHRVGRTLGECATRSGDLVARYGGEEFAAILPAMDASHAAAVAEAMRCAVMALRLESPGPSGMVTISIGVAHAQRADTGCPNALVRAADAALYAAKHGGRNRVSTVPLSPGEPA